MSTGLSAQGRLRTLLANEETFATVLVTIFLDLYGMEALEWSPETIQMEFRDDFGLELPKGNLDKLMAAIGILTTDDFYKRLPVFVQYCNVLSGDDFRPDVFDPADAMECAWGIVEGLLLSPPEEEEPFSDEIRSYIGRTLDEEGIKDAPDVLGIALRNVAGDANTDWSPDFSAMSLTDPTMFAAEYQVQQDKGREIVDSIREGVMDLIRQLESLPLQNGRTEGLLQKLQAQGWRS
jgi:hypothetical protein